MESSGSTHLAAEGSSKWYHQRFCPARRAGLKGKGTYYICMVLMTSHWRGGLQPFSNHLRGWPEQRAADEGLEGAQAGSTMVQLLGVICTSSVSTSSPSLSGRMLQRWKTVWASDCLGPCLQTPKDIFFRKIPCSILRSTVWVQQRVESSLAWSLLGEGQRTRLKGREPVSLSQ